MAPSARVARAVTAAPATPVGGADPEAGQAGHGHDQGGVVAVAVKNWPERRKAVQFAVGAGHVDGGVAVDRPGGEERPGAGGRRRGGQRAGRGGDHLGVVDLLQCRELAARGHEGPPAGQDVVAAPKADDGPIGVGEVGAGEGLGRRGRRRGGRTSGAVGLAGAAVTVTVPAT